MNEKIEAEIKKGATFLGITEDDAKEKFSAICADNSLETTDGLAIGLWRSYVMQQRRSQSSNKPQSNDSLFKSLFGFFVSLEQPRDMMSWNRNRAREEFIRDSDNALETGLVATATENALGKWVITRYHHGNHEEKTVSNLPAGAEQTEDGSWYIPLDSIATYNNGGVNKNYGKPLPVEEMRRAGIFYGSADGGDMKPYFFSYKKQHCVEFSPNTFEFVHFSAIVSEDGTNIYGATDTTLKSLKSNEDLDPNGDDYRDTSNFNVESILQQHFSSNITYLSDLGDYHIRMQGQNAKERYVITDGTVVNINNQPTANGNRIINLNDLNAEFSYDGDDSIVTAWIPSDIEIDFGIGSSVIIVGRTSQRTDDDGYTSTSVNVTGLLVTDRRGSSVEITEVIEENYDWF